MNNQATIISPTEARRLLAAEEAILIDIREQDEFERRHIAGAQSLPLSRFNGEGLSAPVDRAVIFTCRSGMRTSAACDQLAASAPARAYILEGGVDGWQKAGLPVAEDRSAPLELIRQVQIGAGILILVGVLLGHFVAPVWFLLSGFVGAGLLIAGITGFCGMARLLMLAPWNRRARARA